MSGQFLREIKNIFSDELDKFQLAAAYAVLDDVLKRDVSLGEKSLAAALVILDTIKLIAENTTIEISGEKVKLRKVLDSLGVMGEIVNFSNNYNTAIDELDDPKNNGQLSPQTISGIFYGLSNIVDVAINALTSHIPAVPAQILKFASKTINISLAFWHINSESLQEAIDSNFNNIKLLHDRFSLELENRSSSYISTYNNAVQKASEISGLSIEELAGALGDSLTVEAFIKNVASDEITDFKNRLNRAEEFGLNESYDEAKATVEMWIGEGAGDKGEFDALAEMQITIWLKEVYANALDKIQADILSDTHNDTLNTINAQLAGIINGYSHIDEADKAAILAGWQQKFAGEFALERNGSDALLLDEIAQLMGSDQN